MNKLIFSKDVRDIFILNIVVIGVFIGLLLFHIFEVVPDFTEDENKIGLPQMTILLGVAGLMCVKITYTSIRDYIKEYKQYYKL